MEVARRPRRAIENLVAIIVVICDLVMVLFAAELESTSGLQPIGEKLWIDLERILKGGNGTTTFTFTSCYTN